MPSTTWVFRHFPKFDYLPKAICCFTWSIRSLFCTDDKLLSPASISTVTILVWLEFSEFWIDFFDSMKMKINLQNTFSKCSLGFLISIVFPLFAWNWNCLLGLFWIKIVRENIFLMKIKFGESLHEKCQDLYQKDWVNWKLNQIRILHRSRIRSISPKGLF